MAIKSGLAAQLGISDETTYGTPVTVSRFFPFVSEGVKTDIARIEAKAILAGRRTLDSSQWVPGDVKVGGQIQFELLDHTMGIWLRHAFGGYTVSGSNPYTQTYTPGDLTGKSFTVQVGRPSVGTGVVQPFTYSGCKVSKWQIACQAGQIATAAFDVVGQDEITSRVVTDGVTTSGSATLTSATAYFTSMDIGSPISGTGIPSTTTILSVQSTTSVTLSANATATATAVSVTVGVALATASYSTVNPVSYVSGSLSVAGSTVPVKQFTISGDNKLDESRRFVGSQLVSEPLEMDRRDYSIDFDPEFTDMALYQRFLNGQMGSLVVVLASGANTYTFTMNVRFDGETPKVSGTKIVENPIKAVAVGTTDSAAITVVTVNADAAY